MHGLYHVILNVTVPWYSMEHVKVCIYHLLSLMMPSTVLNAIAPGLRRQTKSPLLPVDRKHCQSLFDVGTAVVVHADNIRTRPSETMGELYWSCVDVCSVSDYSSGHFSPPASSA